MESQGLGSIQPLLPFLALCVGHSLHHSAMARVKTPASGLNTTTVCALAAAPASVWSMAAVAV